MASRKRKVAASRPQPHYDTHRFTSKEAWNCYTDNVLGRNILPERNVKLFVTKFDEFRTKLVRRNWHRTLTNLIEGSIDVALVKEFYANLYVLRGKPLKQVRVRGHLIKFDVDSLNTFLETPVVLELGVTLPAYSQFCSLRPNPQELAARLCIPGRGFVLNVEVLPWKLLRKDLTTLVQT